MGMAASQARYLGLQARKSNCEYEGQQINQARVALANQTADAFNQMLALEVPDCPDKTDFTTVQYSYSDGVNGSVLDNWRQLSDSSNDYNYVVDHYYYADIYTGSQKLVSDPQVTTKNDSTSTTMEMSSPSSLSYNDEDSSYTYTSDDGETYTYEDLTQYKYDAELQNAILDLASQGYIETNEYGEVDTATLNSLRGYHDGESWNFATVEELEASINDKTLNSGVIDLSSYDLSDIDSLSDEELTEIQDQLYSSGYTSATDANNTKAWLNDNYQDGSSYYDISGNALTDDQAYTVPSFNEYTTEYTPTAVGNNELTELGALSASDEAALAQILKDLPDSSLADYVTLNSDGSIDYQGSGVYTYTDNGVQKFTTYDDLVDCMETPLFNDSPIDAQTKLTTYEANYIYSQVLETDYALLETDGDGRFTTVKFEDDSTTYTLNVEQVTDEDAYNDAMNQYYYQTAEYEQEIADINAQTEVIQQQDLVLELRLTQLDTEHNALQTEMEAVKSVIEKNIETTFKTFSS